jgi:hypothetical protein
MYCWAAATICTFIDNIVRRASTVAPTRSFSFCHGDNAAVCCICLTLETRTPNFPFIFLFAVELSVCFCRLLCACTTDSGQQEEKSASSWPPLGTGSLVSFPFHWLQYFFHVVFFLSRRLYFYFHCCVIRARIESY